MFEPKIKINKALYDKAVQAAAERGYASVDEFVVHLLEEAVAGGAATDDEEEIRKRLQGLGYIE